LTFNRQIRPILSEHCFACHGLDDPQGGLRLDFAEYAYKGGKSGFPAIAPGDLEESEILHRVVSTDMDDRMPPKGEPPSSPNRSNFCANGSPPGLSMQKHWAYVVPQRPALPKVEDKNFVKTPVDQFILSKLEEKKWVPVSLKKRKNGSDG
jgi:hypothetical protein